MPRPPRFLNALLLLIPVGFAIGCATAPLLSPEYTPAQRRIDRLVRGTYLPQYVEGLERSALRVAGQPSDQDLAEDQRLRPRIEKELAPDAVVSDVVRRVSTSYDESAVEQLERFRESPTGRKVYEASGAPYSWLSRFGYATFGGPTDNPPERVALAEKLDRLTLASKFTTDLYLRVYEALVRWYQVRAPMSPEVSTAVGGADGLIARERERTVALFYQHGVPFMLYAFSDLSTPELEEYVAFVESPAGEWYGKAVREALTETIERRSQAIER